MLHEKVLGRALTGTGTSFNFAGTWKNELGSTMKITQTGDLLDGDYVSAKSGTGTETHGILKGYVDGKLISFVVHWDKFQAISAWVGQVVPPAKPGDPDVLSTLWQMTKAVNSGDEWAAINAGADTFTRT